MARDFDAYSYKWTVINTYRTCFGIDLWNIRDQRLLGLTLYTRYGGKSARGVGCIA